MESRHLSASRAWNAAREAGVQILVVENRLELRAARKPPEAMIRTLTDVREQLIILLRQEPGKLCGIDYIDHFDERSAFGEYEAGMTRIAAELNAYECCVSLWLSQNLPEIPDRYRCVHCGTDTGSFDLALALQCNGRNAWIHSECHRHFLAARRKQAMEALATFGLRNPSDSAIVFGKKAG